MAAVRIRGDIWYGKFQHRGRRYEPCEAQRDVHGTDRTHYREPGLPQAGSPSRITHCVDSLQAGKRRRRAHGQLRGRLGAPRLDSNGFKIPATARCYPQPKPPAGVASSSPWIRRARARYSTLLSLVWHQASAKFCGEMFAS